MQQIKISELKPHSKNEFYFDDVQGEKWKEFLESVKTSGIIEPIVVTQDRVIVSGHQRVRACKELKIETIMCEVRIYDTEDKIIKDLLETNIRQRGTIDGSATKQGRRYVELERIYGINNGGKGSNQYMQLPKTSEATYSQSDLAKQNGVSVDTWNNYKKLTQLIPEIGDLIDTGIVKPTTASTLLTKLSPLQQEELIQSLDVTKKLTQKEVQRYIDKIKQLESRPPREIDNTDYTSLDKKTREIQDLQKKYDLQSEKIDILNERAAIFEENSEKYKQLKSQIEDLTKDKNSISEQIKAATSLSGLIVDIRDFLSTKLSPIKYSRAILEMEENPTVIKNISNIVECVQEWCNEMKNYLSDDTNNVIDINMEEK